MNINAALLNRDDEVIKVEKATPYMLRNDGKLFKCGNVHPYVRYFHQTKLEDILSDKLEFRNILLWFDSHTQYESTKRLIYSILTYLKFDTENNYDSKPVESDEELWSYINLLTDETNQEFCKVRTSALLYGGSKDNIYFRISSIGFNWFDNIWNVIMNNQDRLSEITICKDTSTFGNNFESYKINGQSIIDFPVKEFLTLSGNPLIENIEYCSKDFGYFYSGLQNKQSLVDLFRLFHPHHIEKNYKYLVREVLNKELNSLLRRNNLKKKKDKNINYNAGNVEYGISFFNNATTGGLSEDIEKHNRLNPKLWTIDNELHSIIRNHLDQIVDQFVSFLNTDDVKISLKDVLLLGSNVSYNYTKDSDLDVHIIADSHSFDCSEDVLSHLYSAYRSMFNNTFDIKFYHIPVELYVELDETSAKSNGIYSLNTGWIKFPEIEAVPEIDKEEFDKLFNEWETRYNSVINKNVLTEVNVKLDEIDGAIKIVSDLISVHGGRVSLSDIRTQSKDNSSAAGSYINQLSDLELKDFLARHGFKIRGNMITESLSSDIDNINKFIDDIYNLRKESIAKDGEYGLGNLVFKEFRNKGYLDKLKDLKNEYISKELSVENMTESIVKNIDKTTAYMLRNDGKLLKCGIAHPYIKMYAWDSDSNNITELLINHPHWVTWFYDHSSEFIQQLIEKFISVCLISDDLKNMYNWDKLKSSLDNLAVELNIDNSKITDITFHEIFIQLNDATNKEFCKVRTSNFKYKTGGDNGEIYFRLGSNDVNWFEQISNVVMKFSSWIKNITVMKDYQVFNRKFDYISVGRKKINHMPLDEFIELHNDTIIEACIDNYDILKAKLIERYKTLANIDLNKKLTKEDFVDQAFNQLCNEKNCYKEDLYEMLFEDK